MYYYAIYVYLCFLALFLPIVVVTVLLGVFPRMEYSHPRLVNVLEVVLGALLILFGIIIGLTSDGFLGRY